MCHIPEREASPEYAQAVASVKAQTRQPDQFILEVDPGHTGAGATLNRAVERVTCDWIAQLGDDDYFLPEHLERLAAHAGEADVIWPDCQTLGREDLDLCGDFDADRLARGNWIPGGGSLVRTSAARAVGWWPLPSDPDWQSFEDLSMWRRMHAAGFTFQHFHDVTWVYRFWPGQTGGQL